MSIRTTRYACNVILPSDFAALASLLIKKGIIKICILTALKAKKRLKVYSHSFICSEMLHAQTREYLCFHIQHLLSNRQDFESERIILLKRCNNIQYNHISQHFFKGRCHGH